MMNEQDLARRMVRRLNQVTEQPLAPVERWFTMLLNHWDFYAAEVANEPYSTPWRPWGADGPTDDYRNGEYQRALVTDNHLKAMWQSLEGLKAVWEQRWDMPEYLAAQDQVIAAARVFTDWHGWHRQLCFAPPVERPKRGWVEPWEGIFRGRDDYHVLFVDWLGYALWVIHENERRLNDLLADRAKYQNRKTGGHIPVCLSYSVRQSELAWRKRVAIYHALDAIRREVTAGTSWDDVDHGPLTAACALDGGNFDAQGQVVWFSNLTSEKKADWIAWRASLGLPPDG